MLGLLATTMATGYNNGWSTPYSDVYSLWLLATTMDGLLAARCSLLAARYDNGWSTWYHEMMATRYDDG